tara:strand:+ start:65 stop:532 length:468 start_codon:yes stop_codon:yes gene_type:complete
MNQAMTPEEKAAVMQFMGQTYGHFHKHDQNIVGNAGNLKPKSQEMKQVFEQTARMPTVHPSHQPQPVPQQAPAPQQAPPQQAPAPQPVQPVTPEQAAQEIAAVQSPPMPDQEEFDFSEPAKIDKLIDLIEKQTLILEKISLKLDNGKSAKNRKQR